MTAISNVNHGACPMTAPDEGTDLEEPVLKRVTLLHLIPADKTRGKHLTQGQAIQRLASSQRCGLAHHHTLDQLNLLWRI